MKGRRKLADRPGKFETGTSLMGSKSESIMDDLSRMVNLGSAISMPGENRRMVKSAESEFGKREQGGANRKYSQQPVKKDGPRAASCRSNLP
jgi:hypothetical protein